MKTFDLIHPSGISATVSALGATLRSLSVPDRNGNAGNILIGTDNPYAGSTIGRFANRIAEGRFQIGGRTFELSKNDGANHLHGGSCGFDKILWETESTAAHSVRLRHISPHGEEGYPGTLVVTVEYTLRENCLVWKASATTDMDCPVNLTSHPYFNLRGDPAACVSEHILWIDASEYLPVNGEKIPTGRFQNVAGTPFDFTSPREIGRANISAEGGYDHNFVLKPQPGMRLAARVEEPQSGRILELSTNQPGLQFYLPPQSEGKHPAFCLEPQKFPDSPNQPDFPDSILRSGETYVHEICFDFPKPGSR